jgi:hypothetical protein
LGEQNPGISSFHHVVCKSDILMHGGSELMSMKSKAAVLAVLLLFAVACSQSKTDGDRMGTKQTYSLCPKAPDARQRLQAQVEAFARQHSAQVFDRSAGVQQELSSIDSSVLEKTGGTSILVTIEKPDEFRISVTNLGLREKVALTIRTWRTSIESESFASFMDEIGHYWVIRTAEDGITDDPPC